METASGPRDDSASESDKVRVVLGRFETLVARGLVEVLREDSRLDVLASGLENSALEHTVAERAPRVAILDEPGDGLQLARLRSIAPATGLLVLADEPSRWYGMLLLAAGVTCLERRLPVTDLLATVHLAANGARVSVADRDQRVEWHDGPLLTPRETEVLWHVLVHGDSHQRTARALRISIRTVQKHAAQGYGKLDGRTKRELAGR